MTRSRIRAKAMHVVVDQGWQGLTLKTVGLFDVSWQTVKHHFKTTDGLHEAVAEHMRGVLDSKEAKGNLGAAFVKTVRLRLEELQQIAAA